MAADFVRRLGRRWPCATTQSARPLLPPRRNRLSLFQWEWSSRTQQPLTGGAWSAAASGAWRVVHLLHALPDGVRDDARRGRGDHAVGRGDRLDLAVLPGLASPAVPPMQVVFAQRLMMLVVCQVFLPRGGRMPACSSSRQIAQ